MTNPSFLVTDPGHAIPLHGRVTARPRAFAAAADGSARLGAAATGGTNSVHLALDPSGRALIVANYASGSVALLPVRAMAGWRPRGMSCRFRASPARTGPSRPAPTRTTWFWRRTVATRSCPTRAWIGSCPAAEG